MKQRRFSLVNYKQNHFDEPKTSTVTLPPIAPTSQRKQSKSSLGNIVPEPATQEYSIAARIKNMASVGQLRKLKLKYPSKTDRKHTNRVEQELAQIVPDYKKYHKKNTGAAADINSGDDSHDGSEAGKILGEFVAEDAEKEKIKDVQVVLLKKVKNKTVKEKLVGEEAVNAFYDRYKNIKKVHERQHYEGIQNPITLVLSILSANNLPPKRLQIIKLKGSDAILDIKNCGLGKGAGPKIIAQLVSKLQNFQSIDLSYNQIQSDAAATLIPGLGVLQSVSLAHNKIGKIGCHLLAGLLCQPTCRILNLSIENNYIIEASGIQLIDSLILQNRIKILNMSKNFLGNSFALRMKRFIENTQSLEELYLHWNEITEKGGRHIFEALTNNSTVKVFDISWNELSGGKQCLKAICEFLKMNKTMLHMDISFCELNQEDTLKISAALESNSSLYGLHYEGNMGYVDYRGGLIANQTNSVVEYPIPIKRGILRRIRGLSLCSEQNEFKSDTKRDCCWICQGWQEVYFKFPKFADSTGECYVHLEFQNFKPIKMDDAKSHFETIRMCPQGSINFYFTTTPPPRIASSSFHPMPQDSAASAEPPKMIPNSNPPAPMNRQVVEYTQQLFVTDNYEYLVYCHCLPRSQVHVIPEYKQQIIPQVVQKRYQTRKLERKIKKKETWQEKVEYKAREVKFVAPEDCILRKPSRDQQVINHNYIVIKLQEFHKQCLQYDIANSKIFKVLSKQEDQQKFREIMNEHYESFLITYYNLANNNPNLAGIFSPSEYNIQQFIGEQKYESKRVTLAKIMLKLYACLTGTANEQDKLIARPQFLEFILRLAQEKWATFVPPAKGKTGTKEVVTQVKNNDEDQEGGLAVKKIPLPMPLLAAIQRMVKTLKKYAERVNPQYWRLKRYLNGDTQLVFKNYEGFLQQLYTAFAGRRNKLNKGPKAMTIDEFKDIFLLTDFRKSKEALKDCEDCFLDAKTIETSDNLSKAQTLEFMEFVEALARYSDKVSLPPINTEKDQLWTKDELKKKVPLFLKFESLIIHIYRRLIDLQSKNMNKMAEMGMFPEEGGALLEIFKANEGEMNLMTKTKFRQTGFKMNSMFSMDDINLSTLVAFLEDKHRNQFIVKEREIEEVEEYEETVEV